MVRSFPPQAASERPRKAKTIVPMFFTLSNPSQRAGWAEPPRGSLPIFRPHRRTTSFPTLRTWLNSLNGPGRTRTFASSPCHLRPDAPPVDASATRPSRPPPRDATNHRRIRRPCNFHRLYRDWQSRLDEDLSDAATARRYPHQRASCRRIRDAARRTPPRRGPSSRWRGSPPCPAGRGSPPGGTFRPLSTAIRRTSAALPGTVRPQPPHAPVGCRLVRINGREVVRRRSAPPSQEPIAISTGRASRADARKRLAGSGAADGVPEGGAADAPHRRHHGANDMDPPDHRESHQTVHRHQHPPRRPQGRTTPRARPRHRPVRGRHRRNAAMARRPLRPPSRARASPRSQARRWRIAPVGTQHHDPALSRLPDCARVSPGHPWPEPRLPAMANLFAADGGRVTRQGCSASERRASAR